MARAVFGGGLSPYITKAQDRPTPYNPLGALSTAIRQPFVEDVIVPGISRIRDEMRIAEQEEQIAAQAEAKRAAAAQFLQQAAAAEQQGLDAEVAAAVSGVDVPLMGDNALRGLAMTPARRAAEAGAMDGTRAGWDLVAAAADASPTLGASMRPHLRSATMRVATMLERELAAIKEGGRVIDAGPSRRGERRQGSVDKAKRIAKRLREMGLGDVVAEIAQGVSAEEALNAAAARTQQTQQRRGEQEATTAATQRFERALAGELPQVAAAEGAAAQQALTPMMVNGRPGVRTRGYEGDEEQGRIDAIATRAYRRALKDGKSREESVAIGLAAAKAAQPEAIAAQEAQAIASPESIERANRLRQQATDMEREATGIEGTPVYRTFGDHAMAFLDALDSDDVATQMALMESVGGSTDYQPFGKGAMGKAIGKDASMRARKDLLDLKRKYLDAKRREDSAMKLAEKKAELRGKKKRTGARGSGYGKKNDLLLDALVTLNRGDNLTDKQKSQLRRAGGLSESEVSSLTPDRATAWRALTRRVKGKRAESEARDIMRGQATPEERERADERRESAEIKRLDAKAKTAATQAERQASANEAKRLRLARDTRGANGRLDRAQARSRDLSRGIANSNAEAAQAQATASAITGTDEKSKARKTELKMQAQNALTRAQQGEAEKKFADKTVERINAEISDYEAQLRRLPAKAD
jgi:hypothetical protein